jgi:ABC-type dipeptide/oligopeptide/nickel transport system permease component
MTAYVIRRLWQMIPTIAGVILLIFFLFNWVGGDPAQVLAGKISNPEQIANIRKQLGVDQSYWVQLWAAAGRPTRRCPGSCSPAWAPRSRSWSRCS